MSSNKKQPNPSNAPDKSIVNVPEDPADTVPSFPNPKQARAQVKEALTHTKDPYLTISNFQQNHSLHSFLSKAFGTTSIYSLPNGVHNKISNISASGGKRLTRGDVELKNSQLSQGVLVEPFQPDSVLTFLHHLGVSRYEIHKRISDAVRDKLESEIQKIDLKTNTNNGRDALLELLQSTWEYVHVPELRPVFVTLIKKLGDQTPKEVLILLAKKKRADSTLRYAELLDQFDLSMKRLVWEADWFNVVRGDGQLVVDASTSIAAATTNANTAGTLHSTNILSDIVHPIVKSYVMDANLRKAADLAFTTAFSDRKMDTLKRRTIASSSSGTTSIHTVTTSVLTGTLSSLTSKGLVKSSLNNNVDESKKNTSNNTSHVDETNNTGVALAKLKEVMGSRPKLLSAVLNMLIAEHGLNVNDTTRTSILGGSSYLHCTLVSDIILSHGQLPKQYEFVQILAQILDDSVKKGLISDQALAQIQGCLRSIFQASSTDKDTEGTANSSTIIIGPKTDKSSSTTTNNSSAKDESDRLFERKLLRTIIKKAVARMKDNDSQQLFLNPVTDVIAPGYSKIITKPICLSEIQQKAIDLQYTSLKDFENDVQLMFSNCIRYNSGAPGQWFRGEARRQQKKLKESVMKECIEIYNVEMTKRKNIHVSTENSPSNNVDEAERILAKQQTISKKLAESKRGVEKRKIQSISERNDKSITGLVADDVCPLPKSRGKRRKTDTDFPSMPVLASMILSDPLVVRLLVFKVLNAIKNDVLKGKDIPANNKTIPSIMQLLYIVQISTMLCAKKGKVYVIPDVGFTKTVGADSDGMDSGISESFIALRKHTALLTKLILEAEVDQRFSIGGDFYCHLSSSSRGEFKPEEWIDSGSSSASSAVILPFVQGALIPFLRPTNISNEMSLLVQLPRFFLAIDALSGGNMINDKSFYVSMVETILKHKSKLPHSVRDLIVRHWLNWFKSTDGSSSMTGAVHLYLIKLLNEVSVMYYYCSLKKCFVCCCCSKISCSFFSVHQSSILSGRL